MKLSQRVKQMAASATLAVSAAAAKRKAEGADVISFGAGEPDFNTPANIRAAAQQAIEEGKTKYAKPASGIPEAKQAVLHKLAHENQLQYQQEQVIITAGGKMTLALAIHAVIDPGDEVVIPKPYWVSYPEIVKMAGGKPVFAQGPAENDYKLRPQDLEDALSDKTAIVILNSPSNPSGVTYHPDEMRALTPVLEDRNLLVISDEIYDRLLYGDQQTLSFAATGPKAFDKTLTVNSASKTFAMTGWRIAYAAGPIDLIKAMSKIQSQTTSGAVTFNQSALVEALTGSRDAVEDMRREFEKRRDHMYRRLMYMPGVTCPKPTGAFYCFPNVSSHCAKRNLAGSVEFAGALLEEKDVAVVPGIAFGMDEHVRLSFATSMDQIDKGLDRMTAFLA